ncbi:MAG: 4Fe-4S binding protein [candidate division Zixibacteria bacterium]|nr:4Fe-4S binding protein [candidate division Zixibacteria bacterium]
MCEFCTKHGEGKKWYLQAKNYSLDLASDTRRKKMISRFFGTVGESAEESLNQMKKLKTAPRIIQSLISANITRKYKKEHFGQVVPIEDVEKIFEIINSIVRLPCICRKTLTGKEERYCFGISALPTSENDKVDSSYLFGPYAQGLEKMEKSDALKLIKEFEAKGSVHSIWTFITPFIGGLCNCDRSDCLAMVSTLNYDIKFMFKAEYVARVDWEKCSGCRSCMQMCQFGAMGYSVARERVFIDINHCYGCGVCRAACPNDAINLVERMAVKEASKNW